MNHERPKESKYEKRNKTLSKMTRQILKEPIRTYRIKKKKKRVNDFF